MKIKIRLTLLFTISAATILLSFAAILYLSSENTREREFYLSLENEAITKANLFLEVKVDPITLHKIYSNNRQILNEAEVAIYNPSFELLYHDAVDIDVVKETQEMISEIYKKGIIKFYQDKWQVIGIKYNYNGDDYIITAAAFDQYGYSKQDSLLASILFMIIIALIFIFASGYFLSNRALKPVKEIIDEVNKITVTNLDLRIKPHSNKDELFLLCQTFNAMLDRLENSFDAQKQFVSNISHELRTPLAAIIAELELAQKKGLTKKEYAKSINNASQDANRIVRLSNSLLDFAKASYDPSEISFKKVRVDEILLDACQQLQQSNPEYKFFLNFEEDIDLDNLVLEKANPYLLQVAFVNILENACKFSDNKECKVLISSTKKNIDLFFSDEGIGMEASELDHIFTPFYRGKNQTFSKGNGIGLSLTNKIILLHKGDIQVSSEPKKGTTFKIRIPRK